MTLLLALKSPRLDLFQGQREIQRVSQEAHSIPVTCHVLWGPMQGVIMNLLKATLVKSAFQLLLRIPFY